MAKALTREKADLKKSQAARFMERIGQPDRADEFEQMSIDDYAEGKGLRLSNPTTKERKTNMATPTETKADLQDRIDEAIGILDDAYAPEVSREDLAEAVGSALATLRGEADEDDDDEDDEESADDLD